MRARLAFGLKGIKHDVRFMANDDVDLPTSLVGKKIAPIWDDGSSEPYAESLDIVRNVDADDKYGPRAMRQRPVVNYNLIATTQSAWSVAEHERAADEADARPKPKRAAAAPVAGRRAGGATVGHTVTGRLRSHSDVRSRLKTVENIVLMPRLESSDVNNRSVNLKKKLLCVVFCFY